MKGLPKVTSLGSVTVTGHEDIPAQCEDPRVRKRVRPPKLMCQVELRDSSSFGTCLRCPGGG